jgi:hypothetical protein
VAGDIWLADVARAFAALRPATAEERRQIAGLLGVGPPAAPADEPVSPPAEGEQLTQVTNAVDQPEPEADAPAGAAPTADLPLLTPVAREPVSAVGWGVRSLPRSAARPPGPVPGREPLLAPRGAASILQAMIARSTEEGPLDVATIVDFLARRQTLERLPREVRPTLRFGVQVLVDMGLAMEPFAGDQAQVIAQVRDVAGPQRTSVRYFADAPARGAGPGAGRTWKRYEPPDPGTRVLILSDFGLGGPVPHPRRSQPDEWRSLIGELRRRDCDAVGLLPVPAGRWPAWLLALIPLICWDRTATAGRVSSWLGGR